MPESRQPDYVPYVDLDSLSEPFHMDKDAIADDFALTLVKRNFDFMETWRGNNCDQRWKLNEYLYYGAVPPRVWDGTTIPRSSLPVQIAFDQVESAHARLASSLLTPDEVLGVSPEGDTAAEEAEQIRDRLSYLIDHDIDDFGWSARLELKLSLRDLLIYGNCFGLVEWDEDRRQATVLRLDPRDVYVDIGCAGPYIERARYVAVRRLMTVDDVDSMRDIEGMKIPSRDVLNNLARNRDVVMADRSKVAQEAARGYRYQPGFDDDTANPASRFIEVLIYMGDGKEIWTLNRKVVILNIVEPYGCKRVVSAPCFPVPNRFYAQSYVDVLDPMQQAATALLNRHMDEMALALNPPRAAKSGRTRTPSSLAWRPGLVNEYENPKEDIVVFQPQGITANIWETLGYFEQQAEKRTGQSSLATSGLPRPGNANRTRGGMQMQMQAPAERLGAVASNFEEFLMTPLMYKLLRVEKVHADGDVYAQRKKGVSGAGAARKALAAISGDEE